MADKAFNIERGIKRELVTQIDKIGFLGLGLNKKNNKSNDYREEGAGAQRIDLFIFAVALGVRDGKRTKLKTSESFIKFSALVDRQDEKAFLYSVALEVLRKENKENKIVDDLSLIHI